MVICNVWLDFQNKTHSSHGMKYYDLMLVTFGLAQAQNTLGKVMENNLWVERTMFYSSKTVNSCISDVNDVT